MPGTAWAAPRLPVHDGEVVARLPGASADSRDALRALREGMAERPDDPASACALARHFIELGRTRADPRYYGYAQATLGRWWGQAAPPREVVLLRAVVHQALHDFDAAFDDLERVIASDPRNAQAWLSRALLQQARGEPAAALHSCAVLAGLARPLVAVTCWAGAAARLGRAQEGYPVLARALAADPGAGLATRRWSLEVLADLAAALGYGARAEAHYRVALGLGEPGVSLLAGYSDLLLDAGRAEEVRELLVSQTGPDGLLLRLALAETHLGRREAERHVATLQDRFETAHRRGDETHLREQARAALHLDGETGRALALAQRNWAVQREPADARLMLEAALAAGRPAAAGPVLDWLAHTGLTDVRIDPLVARLRGRTGAVPR